MAVIETWYNQDVQTPVQVQYLNGNVFSQDNLGNLIGVHVFDDGAPAVLSGTVSGNVIRADGGTVAITGTLSGNDCYIILPAAAYAIPGPISIIIKLSGGGSDATLCAVVANVYQASTDTAVDPGTIIPSIEALIAAIEAAVASIPADYSDLWESIAPNFNTSTTYSIGQYVTYNGNVYRFVNQHTGTWNASDVVSVSIGNEIYNTKTELSEFEKTIDGKVIINDLIETSIVPALFPLDDTGTVTTGKAWRKNKGTVDGSQYKYITYNVPSSYAGNIAIVYGHGWGEPYPLVCFYDSNMDFITSAGERGNTMYKGLPVVIPENTATIVVNARTDETFTTGIAFYAVNDFIGVSKKVGTYSQIIDETIISAQPSYADVRNLPTNCVYSLAYNAYTYMTNLPNELSSYATILKVNGANGAQLSGGNAYNLYICANEYNLWIGFENADALVWRLISGNTQPAKKYLFIGDSYGDGYSHDGNNSGWCEYLAQAMGLSSGQYESVHQGGSGFANAGFLARLNAAVGSGFTDIVVLGGFNDYNSTAADIATGISNFCSRAKTLFPNSTVYIGCVGWIKEGTGESAYQNWQEVRAAITGKVLPTYQACGKYGAKYVSFSEYLLNDDLMTNTDGYHPGEAGNKAIAQGMINGIATGCACLPFKSVLKS